MKRITAGLAAAVALAASLVEAEATMAGDFRISGRGWGHGVGMSQYGAQGFASRGRSYREILGHYYRGARLATVPAAARVRVLVADRASVTIAAPTALTIIDGRGRTYLLPRATVRLGGSLTLRALGHSVPLTAPVWLEAAGGALTLGSARYRDRLVVRPSRSGVSVVNDLDLEHYVRGVVASEVPSRWHPEALKAQAVAARSYAAAAIRPDRPFDLYADTRSQVYGGIAAETRRTDAAVAATRGQVLAWRGRPATTFYHSSSGGRTAAVADGMPGARVVPYLRAVPDPYDRAAPRHRWTRRVAASALAALVGLEQVSAVHTSTNASGRVRSVRISDRWSSRAVSGTAFARAFGLPSAWFRIGTA